jgi:hypothetical protein
VLDKEFEKYEAATIREVMASNKNFVQCPKCPFVIERLAPKESDINFKEEVRLRLSSFFPYIYYFKTLRFVL